MLRLTHCQRGHEFSADNIYVAPDGKRRCRACMDVRYKTNRKKRQATDREIRERAELVRLKSKYEGNAE